MNKQELIAKIAKDTGSSKAGASAAVDSLIDGITRSLKRGDSITFVGFGTFKTAQRKARMCRFGVLFQHGALFSAFSVGENIGFPLKELGIATADEIHDLVALKLAMVEMEPEHARLMPAELSGGMIKRAALARALALEPELLLLDEPTAGLDPDRSAAFVELIRSLQGELGLTVVLVTHDLDTLAALATKVAVLAERRILSYASLEETLEVEHPFIRRFFKGEYGRRAHARRSKEE